MGAISLPEGEEIIRAPEKHGRGKEALSQILQGALGEKGLVREFIPRVTLKIKDLNCCTEKEDVLYAQGKNFTKY